MNILLIADVDPDLVRRRLKKIGSRGAAVRAQRLSNVGPSRSNAAEGRIESPMMILFDIKIPIGNRYEFRETCHQRARLILTRVIALPLHAISLAYKRVANG